MESLKTGDILLCRGDSGDDMIDKIIEDFTHSPYIHAGIVIKDPWWINLKGTFVYQSNRGPNGYPDVLNPNLIKGVTLNHIGDFLNGRKFVEVRRLSNIKWNNQDKDKFEKNFSNTYNKPYDMKICEWICVGISSFLKCECFSNEIIPRETDTFWCSSLVAYIYSKMGWIDNHINWSSQTPYDLSIIQVIYPYSLSNLERIK
jgi:hypothetical protein